MDRVKTVKVKISLPARLLERIDERVGHEYLNRNDFVNSAIHYYFDHFLKSGYDLNARTTKDKILSPAP